MGNPVVTAAHVFLDKKHLSLISWHACMKNNFNSQKKLVFAAFVYACAYTRARAPLVSIENDKDIKSRVTNKLLKLVEKKE